MENWYKDFGIEVKETCKAKENFVTGFGLLDVVPPRTIEQIRPKTYSFICWIHGETESKLNEVEPLLPKLEKILLISSAWNDLSILEKHAAHRVLSVNDIDVPWLDICKREGSPSLEFREVSKIIEPLKAVDEKGLNRALSMYIRRLDSEGKKMLFLSRKPWEIERKEDYMTGATYIRFRSRFVFAVIPKNMERTEENG